MGRSLQRQFLRNFKSSRTLGKGKCNFDIDVAGGLRIKSKFPDETLAVFVKPPSSTS
jgi:guanylate kinase